MPLSLNDLGTGNSALEEHTGSDGGWAHDKPMLCA